MLDTRAVQEMFSHYNLGKISSVSAVQLDFFQSAAARVQTDSGLYAFFPTAKPFKIGGGIHLQIVLPQAQQTIGPAALLVSRDESNEETLPTIKMAGQYWVIFRADASAATNKPEPVAHDFVEYRDGKAFEARPEYDVADRKSVV